MTIALVTGSNSGIGRSAAVELARRGWTVYGSMRSLDKGDKLAAMAEAAGTVVHPVVMEVTDDASVRSAVAEVLEDAGAIDVLVNNAGIGGNGVVEECTIEQFHEAMDVNLYGVIRCTQAVLPQMRDRGSGAIVNVSSVVGEVAHIGQAPYYTSKWALEGLSEGLAHELAPFGIRVVIVQPGITKSAIFAKNVDAPNDTGAYGDHYERLFQFYSAGLPHATPAEEVGGVIHDAVTTDDYRLRWRVSWGGEALASGRAAMSDEDWVGMGALPTGEYYDRFQQLLGVDIHPV